MTTTTTRNALIKHEALDINVPYNLNTNMDTIDAALAKCNFAAATDPGVGDDSADGYATGSRWHNTTGHKAFVCEAATAGAAVWRQVWPALLADQSLAADWDAGNYEIRAKTFESDVATGTAPLTIASTTKVTNLNADKLDDLEGAAYAILAGQSGGQTLEGDTASGGNLTLKSTHHATKGSILFGTSAYDEVNNRLGIGKVNPSQELDIVGTCRSGGIPYPGYHLQSTSAGSKQWSIVCSAGDLLLRNETDEVNVIHVYNSGGISLGSSVVDPNANNLYITGDVNCASVTDHTPAYEGDALKEIEKVVAKDGKIDHTTLPDFVQKEYKDKDGETKIGRDLGGMVSVLTVGIQQLKEFYEDAVADRDKKIAELATRLEKLEEAAKV